MAPPDAEQPPPERLPRRLETVRFYVDEDLLPVGNAMMWARTDVVVCGARLIADELPLGTPDLDSRSTAGSAQCAPGMPGAT